MKHFETLNPKRDWQEILRRFRDRMKALSAHKRECKTTCTRKHLMDDLHMREVKKLFIATLLLTAAAVAKADTSTTTTPSPILADLTANTTSHVLDNGTPGFFYDFQSHKMMSGATTEILTYRRISLDFGIVKSIEDRDHTLPVLGANVHIGSFLAQFGPIDGTINKLRLNQGLLKYFTMGAWGGRDFALGKTRYGLYAGLRAQFN